MTLRRPRAAAAAVPYLDPDPAHDRATTRSLDRRDSGRRRARALRRQAGRAETRRQHPPAAQRRFFGLPGVILFMVASLAMPLFAITGWMLYLDRRAQAARARARGRRAAPPTSRRGADRVCRVRQPDRHRRTHRVADRGDLQAGGVPVRVQPLATLQPALAAIPRRCSSPARSAKASRRTRARLRPPRAAQPARCRPALRRARAGRPQLRRFCGFGHRLDRGCGSPARRRCSTGRSRRRRRRRVAPLAAPPGRARRRRRAAGLDRAELRGWRLVEPGTRQSRQSRRRAVPSRAAGDGPAPTWPAGDIAEIGPRTLEAIAAFLCASGHDGDARVVNRGVDTRLADLLASTRYPDPPSVRGLSRHPLAASGQALPHREYSIASLPADGGVQLLVRQMPLPDGRLGLRRPGSPRRRRVGGGRAADPQQPRFPSAGRRPPAAADRQRHRHGRTARAAAGAHRCRPAPQLAAVRRTSPRARPPVRRRPARRHRHGAFAAAGPGVLARPAAASYVQDRLRDNRPRARMDRRRRRDLRLRRLEGMAPGVDAALVDILGAELVEESPRGGIAATCTDFSRL